MRTRNTIVEVYGELFCGKRFCHAAVVRPACATASMSYARARVTTSASSPSITARACPPEPACDCLMLIVCPVFPFQYLTNAALKSWYSSRVGSYETLSSDWAAAVVPSAASVTPSARTRRVDLNRFMKLST